MSSVNDLESLSELIDCIYSGATEPARWPSVMARIAEWLDSPKGMLFTPWHSARQGGFYFQHGLPDYFLDLYKARYQAIDEWMEEGVKCNALSEGTVVLGADLIPHDRFLQSRWYQDFLKIEDIAQMLGSVVYGKSPEQPEALHRAIDLPTVCSFYRGEQDPAYTEDDRRKLQLILPHVSRSLGVMSRLRLGDAEMAVTLSALDRLPTATLLLARDAQVLFANQVARRLMDSNNGVHLLPVAAADGRLRIAGLAPRAELELKRAVASATTDVDVPHFAKVIRSPGVTADGEWVIQLARFHAPERFDGATAPAEVIAFVSDLSRPVHVDPALLRSAYGLTPAEARVALAATANGSAEDIAAQLLVQPSTIKSQLRQIYAKTGALGRADLVRLVLALPHAP
jgi:DNA-binding CsgD family transcriptional regulator